MRFDHPEQVVLWLRGVPHSLRGMTVVYPGGTPKVDAAKWLAYFSERPLSDAARGRLTPDMVRESLAARGPLPAPVCDHCSEPAVFRVALAASYSEEHMEELHYCTVRLQEVAAAEPHRLLGVVNLATGPRTMIERDQ
ncbi:MAG TPA: hypothetical protein VK735_18570 [Pseudonocardia sp.]|uniref:hypothetical protein n=1 Tax=Pseudonocardia sp. TaxID=60912 RepID=UPI002CB25B31|nr:hypothetical protein [Pseudonocardia sp.]HTF49451.1 hypothetical protein [Pseudonocardia sp.]